MKQLLLSFLALALALPAVAQTLTNVAVAVVPPPVVHTIIIPFGQLDSIPAGKHAYVQGGVVAANGTLTLTVTYR
jgi:hypothetical protein